VHVLALPQQFLESASRGELLVDLGLTGQAVARGITELIARRAMDVSGPVVSGSGPESIER